MVTGLYKKIKYVAEITAVATAMKLLMIHADYMEYAVTEKTKFAEDGMPPQDHVENAIVAFISVEKDDSDDAVEEAAEELLKFASSVKVRTLLIYPYAHLSTQLASPQDAMKALDKLQASLSRHFDAVKRAPFGWYKSFVLRCKGHPLAEAFREIRGRKKREEVVAEIESNYVILLPNGQELSLDDLEKTNDSALVKFVKAEILGIAPSAKPPSITAMQKLELIDYEDASDSGHFRFYPKGALMFKLLKKWADNIAYELNALEVSTPAIYDWGLPDIRAQAESFHERHYAVYPPDMKKEFVLRFAGDFGLFRMMKNAVMSYKQLPIRIYEFAQSFRYEKRGELAALRRLRAFHMPDIHSFSATLADGWNEYKSIYKALSNAIEKMNIEYAIAFRVEKKFYDKYKSEILELLSYSGKPALVEIMSARKHYWAVKHEFQGIDSVGNNCQLCTVQLDVEDAERYGIMYVDKNGEKKGCVICHVSVGSIERWIYQMLEEAFKKDKPSLPFWLSPIQVRIIPVNSNFLADCVSLAEKLSPICRVDVDDREDTVSKRIREAEQEWIPMIIVYGAKERESNVLPVRLRETGKTEKFTLDDLVAEIRRLMDGRPFARLASPVLVSKKVVFR